MRATRSSRWFLALLAGLAVATLGAADQADFAWLEGEAPSAVNVELPAAAVDKPAHAEWLSDGKWLSIKLNGEGLKTVPEGGVVLAYDFVAPSAASYELWDRIGFEFIRSSFDWRIDAGEWRRIKPDDLTTDLMELATWQEVAWIRMGDQQLAKGAHKLEIRLQPESPDAADKPSAKGKEKPKSPPRILYCSDAICISARPFHPNSRYRPGEPYQDDHYAEAAKKVFALPTPSASSARSVVALEGLWEICRDDEQLPGEVAAPIAALPSDPLWTAIPVPGGKAKLRPDLEMAHRVWYRTRVEVPPACAGRSFFVAFPLNCLNTTVYVNGQLCGFEKNPLAPCRIDVTKAVRTGVNELCVGIRDVWYGYSTNPKDPLKLRKKFNLPTSFLNKGWQDLAYPVWNTPLPGTGYSSSGLLRTPEFVAAGAVYADDVFCKPSVARKELGVEFTLRNPGAKELSGEIAYAAVDAKSGQVAKEFAPAPFKLPAASEKLIDIAAAWADAKLWWPDEPNLYRLRAVVRVDGKEVDATETGFGFREWSWQGHDFKLNGVVWHGWADIFQAKDPSSWLAFYHATHQRMMRLWGFEWKGLRNDQALDFFDANGVVVRRQGLLDGEQIGYWAAENDPDLKELYHSDIKRQLVGNWRDQLIAQVKAERNHPSIMIWSIENEFLFINCMNQFGSGKLLDEWEAAVAETGKAVMAVDPTRPVISDGGGANKDCSMPVHCDHYLIEDDLKGGFAAYPALAYGGNLKGSPHGNGRWAWDEKRPRFVGEDFWFNAISPADMAYFGGEEAFQGKAGARRGAGIFFRILAEGYRWSGFGAWHFWITDREAMGQYGATAEVAVFCKQWDWTFMSGQQVARTMRVFNDSRRDDPITFRWTLSIDGKRAAGEAKEFRLAPGTASEEFQIALPMPPVAERAEGELTLALEQGRSEVFKDAKAISVLGTLAAPAPAAGKPPGLAALPAGRLLVLDPFGSAKAFLKAGGIAFTAIDSLDALPDAAKVLVVGKDAIGAAEATSTRLQLWASAGRSVILLEQQSPLRYQGLPADASPTDAEGRTAFMENPDHPVFAGLRQKDFFTWGDDQVVYRRAYEKPTRGGSSLVQCHSRLGDSALIEMPVGQGLMLASQLVIGEKLATNATAQRLFANLVDYAAAYRLERRPVTVCAQDLDPLLAKTLEEIKLQSSGQPDPLAALSAAPAPATVIIPASSRNLHALAEAAPKVAAFTAAGGIIVLHGLAPEGLADFNRLVGVDHLLRRFGGLSPATRTPMPERVEFPAQRNALTAGLGVSDVVLSSGERMFAWAAGDYLAPDMFSYVVDYDDIAPFCQSTFSGWGNITNGFVGADGWPLIIDFGFGADGSPPAIPIRLPRAESIIEYTHVASTNYCPTTQVELTFDGKEPLALTTQPDNSPQVFAIDPPRTAQELTLKIAKWEPGKPSVGIDNIAIKVRRSPEFYAKVKPLVQPCGLVQYPQGKGGIVLCNLLFKPVEKVAANQGKKATILAAILRNLKAPFAEGNGVIAGADLAYEAVDISRQATQFRDDKGWFGDKSATFRDLPVGKQKFAGVPFDVYELTSSPVPTVLMLGGKNVPNQCPDAITGIPVKRRADALFFLQAARIDLRRSDKDLKEKKQHELFHYLVRYADGKTATIPVLAEVDIDDYRQKEPAALPGAQLAWVRPIDGKPFSLVAYSMQWNNPRPEIEIASIDMAYPEERRGVPALIALTAASAR